MGFGDSLTHGLESIQYIMFFISFYNTDYGLNRIEDRRYKAELISSDHSITGRESRPCPSLQPFGQTEIHPG